MPRSPSEIDEATLRLLTAPGIGPATIRKMRAHFGTDQSAADASVAQLTALEGVGRATAAEIRGSLDDTDPESERESMTQRGVRLLLRGDADFPPMLAVLPDAPEALWLRGSLVDSDRLAVAIVGSRRCTSYGREQAGRFASLLAQCGLTIVSGGALGIDGEAHRGSLRVGGRTIAVLGCGLAVDYPGRHADLFKRIAEEGGAVLSEHSMHAPPVAQNFPRRNRIISGLALGVLVIEAARRSGALITARLAAEEHGREVMAVPGRVDSPASAGCLKLIRDGAAALVRDHADVLEQLDASTYDTRGVLEAAGVPEATRAATLFDAALTDGQAAVVRALEESRSTVLIDQLAARTQRPMQELMADLTLLEIRGRIERDQRGIRLRRSS